MSESETGIYADFWSDLLERINRTTSHSLQNPKIDFLLAVASVTSLKALVESKRIVLKSMRNRARHCLEQYIRG